MANRKVWLLLPPYKKGQLNSPPHGTQRLPDFVLSIMFAYGSGFHAVELSEFSYLIGVSGSYKDLIFSLFELINNGPKKWNMWRVVQVNPNPLLCCCPWI